MADKTQPRLIEKWRDDPGGEFLDKNGKKVDLSDINEKLMEAQRQREKKGE